MFDVLSEWPSWSKDMLPGLWTSLKLVATLVAMGTPLAIVLALAMRSPVRPVKYLAVVVVEVGRGIPALVLLYLIYFGLPEQGLDLTAFLSAALALGFNFAAYTAEVFRSGIDAIPRGQIEAAQALGLSRSVQLRKVVLPQAIRIVIPPLIGWLIIYFQATSLAFTIAVPELMSSAYTIATVTFQYLAVFILAAVMYAVICIPGSQLAAFLERRQHSGRRMGLQAQALAITKEEEYQP